MTEAEIILSRLALDQLASLTPTIGRTLVKALQRLAAFPESAPPVSQPGYEDYRQLIIKDYRVVYRYLGGDEQVRIYCILHIRPQLPASEFLNYQLF
ncbi:MAG: type II toxin-antitoxin system RelE/ParE family toxin [Chloroflexota bacterium]